MNPTHDDLRQLCAEIDAGTSAISELSALVGDPDSWPRLAATTQLFATRLANVAVEFAQLLAAYSEANPDLVEAPRHGPAVLVLGNLHTKLWSEAVGVGSYLAAAQQHLGRPDLTMHATALDDTERGAMLLTQTLRIDGEDVLMRAYLGGVEQDGVKNVLAEHGITPGPPEFWPPLNPDGKFLSLPGGLFDVYGRPVDLPEPPAGSDMP